MARPIKHRGKWRIRWIDSDGQRRSEVFQEYGDAIRALRGRQVGADEVRAGTRAKRPEHRTFGELCDRWLETRGAAKRSAKDDESICKRLREFFGDRLLSEIGVEDADAYIDEHDELSPKTLANHITLLISMMNYASTFRGPWILKVPKFKKPKIIGLGRNYAYLRTQDEIDRFLSAARDEGEAIYMLYLTAITTGMRAGELAGLEWADVRLDTRLIMVQRSFSGLTKSGHARPVPTWTLCSAICVAGASVMLAASCSRIAMDGCSVSRPAHFRKSCTGYSIPPDSLLRRCRPVAWALPLWACRWSPAPSCAIAQ